MLNAFAPSSVTVSGISIDSSAPIFAKASLPIFATVEGIVIEEIVLHFSNISSGIAVMPAPNTKLTRLSACANGSSEDVTVVGM